MDRQPGHLTPARGDASPAGLRPRATTTTTPSPRRRTPPRRAAAVAAGFTLIEILIVVVILGILAAIVVPQFSNASQVARENMLKDELRYLRTQITVYKAQHGDVPPGYDEGNPNGQISQNAFKIQLLSRTNARGEVGLDPRQFPFGPYLQRIPPNPITQSDGVKMIERGAKFTEPSTISDTDERAFGWMYRPSTQEIVAYTNKLDGRKRPYAGY
jgi:general secretion pathway protein G